MCAKNQNFIYYEKEGVFLNIKQNTNSMVYNLYTYLSHKCSMQNQCGIEACLGKYSLGLLLIFTDY